MSENHRGPEVPEVKAPAVECHDGLARITLEELATMAPSRMLVLQDQELLSVWGKVRVRTSPG